MKDLRSLSVGVTRQQVTLWFLGFLFVWISGLLVVAWGWRLNDKGLPLLVGGIALVLILLHAYSLVRPATFQRFLPAADDESGFDNLVDLQPQFDHGGDREIPGIALVTWMLTFAVLVYYFGYYLVLPAYVFATIGYLRRSLRDAFVATLVLTIFIFVGFGMLLDLRLWEGVVFR